MVVAIKYGIIRRAVEVMVVKLRDGNDGVGKQNNKRDVYRKLSFLLSDREG